MSKFRKIVAYSMVLISIPLCFHCNPSLKTERINNQVSKYYDQELTEITKRKFQKIIDYSYNIDIYKIQDSIRSGYIINRFKKGVMTFDQFNVFKSKLKNSLRMDIDFKHPLRVDYYLKLDNQSGCLEQTRNLEYTKKVDESFVNFVNIHAASSRYVFDSLKYNVVIDRYDVIRETFNQFSETCTNNLIVYPDGSFLSCIGDGCEYLGKPD